MVSSCSSERGRNGDSRSRRPGEKQCLRVHCRIEGRKRKGYVSDHYWTQALAIDNLGEIAGNASIDVAPGNDVVTLWRMSPRTHTWEMIELPTLSGARCGNNDAWAINDVGDVVGSSTPVCDPDPKNWTVNATRWTTNNLRFVKSIGISADWSTAHGVNNLGIAVGKFGNNSDGSDLPFAAAIR